MPLLISDLFNYQLQIGCFLNLILELFLDKRKCQNQKQQTMTVNQFIIYIVYHLEWFTLFQRSKKVEAQPRIIYFPEKE